MARVYAVDLGAWSVKVAIATQGLRGGTVTEVIERQVPPGDGPATDRALAVLGSIVAEYKLGGDSAYWGAYSDKVFTNLLDFEFRNLRKADLDKAIGGELEGLVPIDLEDLAFCAETLPDIVPTPDEGGEKRGRVAAPTLGTRVLTYAMHREQAQLLIESGKAHGAEPKGIFPIAGGVAKLVASLPSLTEARLAPIAVLDIGHLRSDLLVVHSGKVIYSRALSRAGKQITEAIARNWNLSFIEAERAKHSDGFIASAAQPATSEAWDRVHQVLVTEIAPLARDVRQAFASCRAKVGVTPQHVLLVGGSSRLRGFPMYLTEQLGVPVSTLSQADVAAVAPKATETAAFDAAALTVGLALDAAGGRPSFDLRSGSLASKMDLSFLRKKIVPAGIGVFLVLASVLGASYADFYRLKKAEENLSKRVAQESAEYFPDGKSRDAKQIMAETGGQSSAIVTESPLPKWTAYDLLLEINAKVPPKEKVTIDISKIEITRDKVDLAGVAKGIDEIGALVDSLQSIKCFGKIGQGPTDAGENGSKKFTLNIPSTCM